MLKKHEGTSWIMQFDDLNEMVHFLETTPRVWPTVRSSLRGKVDFSGATWDETLRMAREGWEDGVGRVHALVQGLPNKARAERTYSVAGEFADAPRAAAGDPFNMVRRGMAHRQRPVMTIAVSCCCSGATPRSAMENYAAAMVAVVDRLENKGVRVELIGCAVSMLGGARAAVSWTIKRDSDALDLNAVAFGSGHPAMLRRLIFGAWEYSPAHWQCSSYGSVMDAKRRDFIDLPEDALIVQGVGKGSGSHCRTLEDAVAFAQKQINEASIAMCGEPIAELEAVE